MATMAAIVGPHSILSRPPPRSEVLVLDPESSRRNMKFCEAIARMRSVGILQYPMDGAELDFSEGIKSLG